MADLVVRNSEDLNGRHELVLCVTNNVTSTLSITDGIDGTPQTNISSEPFDALH
jgi:hypothetical protein